MTRKQQIRRRYPFTQLIICFHPADQINNEGTGPILMVVAKDMGAVGAEDGRAPDGIHRNGLQRNSVSRGQEALDAWDNLRDELHQPLRLCGKEPRRG